MKHKCHICGIITTLNVMMSSHYKKTHINVDKSQYKKDLLIHNGRKPNNCSQCGKETHINKGEKDYNKFCSKECYYKYTKDRDSCFNPNWKGGKTIYKCHFCKNDIIKYKSSFQGDKKFCSTSCAQQFYAVPSNRTDKQLANDVKNAKQLRRFAKDVNAKIKRAQAMKQLNKARRSKKEDAVFQIIKSLYPNAIQSYQIKYYIFDIFIPNLNLLIEFDGTYWHSLPQTKILDRRKTTYIKHWYPYLNLYRIKEKDWDDSNDHIQLIKNIMST